MAVIAQSIGILAMGANILSYQFTRKNHLLMCQLVGGLLFSVNMFMLDAVMGGILNILAVVRAFVYMHTERLQNKLKLVNACFLVLYAISYALVFTVFGKVPTARNLILEILPVIGMGAMTIGFSQKNTKAIRLCAFINSPCWLIYNCLNLSIGGIACETLSLISAFSAYLRLNTEKRQKKEKSI